MRRAAVAAAVLSLAACNKVDFQAAEQAARYRAPTRVSMTIQVPDGTSRLSPRLPPAT